MQPAGNDVSFLEAAQQGRFVIDTTAANKIIDSISLIQANVDTQLDRIDDLKIQNVFGDLDEARSITKINILVATGDPQSLDSALTQFRDVLEDLRQAVQLCLQTYQHDDEQALRHLPRLSAG